MSTSLLTNISKNLHKNEVHTCTCVVLNLQFLYYAALTHFIVYIYVDLAQAYFALGKTQHRMCLLAESFDSLSKALDISEMYFKRPDYPQVLYLCIYSHT